MVRLQELDLDGDRLKSRIRELYRLFVFVSDNRVYLIHQTAKESLIAKKALNILAEGCWRHSVSEQQSSKIMTEVCVQYLSFRDIQDKHCREGKENGVLLDKHPLLEYSSVN